MGGAGFVVCDQVGAVFGHGVSPSSVTRSPPRLPACSRIRREAGARRPDVAAVDGGYRQRKGSSAVFDALAEPARTAQAQ
jgi:hypothetical protein